MIHVAALRPAAGAPQPRRGFARRRRREVVASYLLLAPALLFVLAVTAYPLAWQIWSSLTDRSVERTSVAYVGLRNYFQLIDEPTFWTAAQHTIAFLAATALLKLAIGVVVALVLARPFRARPLVFLASFLPWAYPGGVALIGWERFMSPPVHTAYSELMARAGALCDAQLGDGSWSFLSLVVFNVWRGGSFVGVFLLAALNAQPPALLDYARLEARSAWRRFWLVTVPLLRPFLALATFLSLVTAVADLGNVWAQTGGRDTFAIVWTSSFRDALMGGQWAKAAALSLALTPALAVMLLACYRLFEPLEEP
jgi:multiple sugar transport system permease protein